MMAFTTHFDQAGRKTYRPTDGLQALLKQDRITRDDLLQFRSSNKVERLIKEVIEKRGFERDDNGKDWVRKKVGCFEWAKAALGLTSNINDGPVQKLLERIKKRDGPIGAAVIFTIANSSEVKLIHESLDAGGWHYEPSDGAYYPPTTPKKVSVAELVQHAVAADWANKHEQDVISDLVGYATADAKPGEAVQIHLAGNQAGKTFKQWHKTLLDTIEKTTKPRRARKPKPAPAPRKRIIPPSQLKRKLAL